MNEIWRDIKGYEGHYQISNFGRVKSLSRTIVDAIGSRKSKEIIMKQKVNAGGYLVVNLSKCGKYKTLFIHRLVAEAFVNNPYKLPQVNHKDENKFNNCEWNLEWCTPVYNSNYGTRNERTRRHKMKRVEQYTKEGVFIKVWDSITTVQEETGMSLFNISMACTGKTKTAFGYIWKYKDI